MEAPDSSGAFLFDRNSFPFRDAISMKAHAIINRSFDDVERFLSSIQFENREKLKELGLEI